MSQKMLTKVMNLLRAKWFVREIITTKIFYVWVDANVSKYR